MLDRPLKNVSNHVKQSLFSGAVVGLNVMWLAQHTQIIASHLCFPFNSLEGSDSVVLAAVLLVIICSLVTTFKGT